MRLVHAVIRSRGEPGGARNQKLSATRSILVGPAEVAASRQ
jgi:hypothetical protein